MSRMRKTTLSLALLAAVAGMAIFATGCNSCSCAQDDGQTSSEFLEGATPVHGEIAELGDVTEPPVVSHGETPTEGIVVDGDDAPTEAPLAQSYPESPASVTATLPPLGDIRSTPVRKLREQGVTGGSIQFVVPGTVEGVASMLTDFNNAQGRRAWARAYRVISQSGNRVVAEWRFKGKMGVKPTVHLGFDTQRVGSSIVISYRVVKRAFGIKRFFGQYRVDPIPEQPGRVRVEERVFIHSGIAFATASDDDIRKGLRKDAELIRAWATERAGG